MIINYIVRPGKLGFNVVKHIKYDNEVEEFRILNDYEYLDYEEAINIVGTLTKVFITDVQPKVDNVVEIKSNS